jgi:thiamine biosynthesis lipoprotein
VNDLLSTVRFRALGTTAVVICESDHIVAATELVRDELNAVDLACSRFRTDSELTRLNDNLGVPMRVSSLLIEAVDQALRAAELTDGIVDPTIARALRDWGYDTTFTSVPTIGPSIEVTLRAVPGWRTVVVDHAASTVAMPLGVELDLGATAKGLAADRSSARVHDALGCGVLVGLGGDIAVAGPPPADGWSVLCADDHAVDLDDDAVIAKGQTVDIFAGGLATSSVTVRRWIRGGARLHHLIDPVIGAPAHTCWRTVSVAASSCVDANIASTNAVIMSEAAVAWLDDRQLPARLVRTDGHIVTTGGWPADGRFGEVPST